MTITSKIMLMGSLSLVLSMFSSSVLPIVGAFHPAKPIFLHFFDDDVKSETDSSKLEENKLIIENDVNTNLQALDKPSTLSEGTKGPLPVTSTNIQNIGLFEDEELKSSADEITGTDSISTAEPNLLEPSDDISMQFTRIYLKAITNLIERIMDALFSVNEYSASTKFSEPPNFDYDSEHSKKLKKRDVPVSENELNISTDPSSADTTSDSSPQSVNLTDNILETDLDSAKEVASDFQTKNLSVSTHQEQTVTKIVNSLEVNTFSKQNTTVHGKITVTPDRKSTNINNNNNVYVNKIDGTAYENIADHVQTKESMLNKNDHSKPEVQDDTAHIKDLINFPNSVMMDDAITKQDAVYHDGINLLSFKPKSADQSSENKNAESDTVFSAAVMIIGTLLIVIVFSAAGVAVAYTLRKRRLHQPLSGNSAQHAAMA